MHGFIGGFGNIGLRWPGWSGRMRMEDSQKFPALRCDALEGRQLLDRTHPKAHGAARFVRDRNDLRHDAIRSRQKAAGLQGKAGLHVCAHFRELDRGNP